MQNPLKISLRSIVKALVASVLPNIRSRLLSKNHDKPNDDRPFISLPTEEVFRKVYAEGVWGGSDIKADFYSGCGSHDPSVVDPYVNSVRAFLVKLSAPQVIVDLGCGDFYVGNQICDLAKEYVACDIVEELIQRNSKLFQKSNLRFVCLNAINDRLPEGDIVVIRQVLQHIGNEQIAKIVQKIARYKYAVITEHLPTSVNFKPNLDKPTGPGIRLGIGSGVVLTEPPFSLITMASSVLCEIIGYGGVIRTFLYQLKAAAD